MGGFTHFDAAGNAIMVDVAEKAVTSRRAVASGVIHVNEAVMDAIVSGTAKKGDVLGVARVAGIMAAKNTASMIPLCHPLPITSLAIDFEIHAPEGLITARCTASVDGKTGVEMEALTGVSVALLTIYDMCKAMDRAMEIREIHLEEKEGGKSGHFRREA
jgi:cyclic pyranopterin phosphate synthase